MRAVQIEAFGRPPHVTDDLPAPRVAAGEELVTMTAAGVNPLDGFVLAGSFPGAQLPLVLGNEGVGRTAEGRRVMFFGTYGVLRDGTWAQQVAVRDSDLVEVPDTLTDAEAAGLLLGAMTAHGGLAAGGFTAGQTVLAPAVGGAVGNATVQLARAGGAARVITTAGSTAKAERARAAGYADVVDLSRTALRDGVHELVGSSGVDLVVDSLGGQVLADALHTLRPGGTAVSVGDSAGSVIPVAADVLRRNLLHLVGFTSTRFALDPQAAAESVAAVVSAVAAGAYRPIVAAEFPLERAGEALDELARRPFGRIVLTVDGASR